MDPNLTVDSNFDPEPDIHVINYDFIRNLLLKLDLLCKPPYELERRWQLSLLRNNKHLKELMRLLSLGRFKDNGERQKLSTEIGFKHTLLQLDAVLVNCP